MFSIYIKTKFKVYKTTFNNEFILTHFKYKGRSKFKINHVNGKDGEGKLIRRGRRDRRDRRGKKGVGGVKRVKRKDGGES